LDLGKSHWKLVTCVEVTLVSKFHPFWCPVAHLPDISTETEHIRSKAEHVCHGVSAATFVHCFDHILLTGCPINLILFPLRS
jgi:hypothetical protein